MKTAINLLISVLILAALIVTNAACYTVGMTDQVILTQFGAPVGKPVTEPGLHFKTPFIQKVNRLDKRILEWDGNATEIPTKDKLYISVDTYARWRITDPLLYFQRLNNETKAQSTLDDILDGETRNAIAKYDLVEIIRTSNRKPEVDEQLADVTDQFGQLQPIKEGRLKIAQQIHDVAAKRLTDLGIELLDIRFKRINYNPTVQQDIYRRMISERNQIADKFRSEGEGEAARIKGQMERDLKQIQSEAYLKTQEIRGRADAEATQIYAKAYNQSEDSARFYQFTKTLETWGATLNKDTTLLLSTDSSLFNLMQSGPADNQPWRPSKLTPLPESDLLTSATMSEAMLTSGTVALPDETTQ